MNWGRNRVDTFIFDTVNASLGPDSPTSFRPNLLQQTDLGLNVDLSYVASDMINVAGGAEWRNERYHLGAGDPASWAIGPYAAQGFGSGSNGYNGAGPRQPQAARSGDDRLSDKRRAEGVSTFAEHAERVLEQKRDVWRGRWHMRIAEHGALRLPAHRPPARSSRSTRPTCWRSSRRSRAPRRRRPALVCQRIRSVLEWAIAMDLRNDNP